MQDDSDKIFPEDPDEAIPLQAPSAADRGSQKHIRERAKREASEATAFWLQVFSSEVGRREMWKLLDTMHYDRERFVYTPGGHSAPEATWAEAGIQRLGFQLYRKWMALAPERVMEMLREHDPALRAPVPRNRRDRGRER
jgi:hypothetical protein